MQKSLSERIAARAVKKKPTVSAQNRAAVLALRSEIKQALVDGWPVKTIWETLHEEQKVTFSYQAFRGYVNRLLLAPSDSTESAPTSAPPTATPSPAPPSMSTPAAKKSKRQEGFAFNPVPNPKELL